MAAGHHYEGIAPSASISSIQLLINSGEKSPSAVPLRSANTMLLAVKGSENLTAGKCQRGRRAGRVSSWPSKQNQAHECVARRAGGDDSTPWAHNFAEDACGHPGVCVTSHGHTRLTNEEANGARAGPPVCVCVCVYIYVGEGVGGQTNRRPGAAACLYARLVLRVVEWHLQMLERGWGNQRLPACVRSTLFFFRTSIMYEGFFKVGDDANHDSVETTRPEIGVRCRDY